MEAKQQIALSLETIEAQAAEIHEHLSSVDIRIAEVDRRLAGRDNYARTSEYRSSRIFVWDNVSWKLAAIHAGDWLVKLPLMAVILGVWRR